MEIADKNKENVEISEGYDFGEFHLNVPLKELKLGDSAVEIQRRVLDLLLYLVRNRDRTVSKEELQEAVWPGTIVTEAALSRAIMKARKALNDDAQEQSFIKTVHGQGYRFVAAVAEAGEQALEVQIDPRERRNALLRVATTYGAGAWLVNQAAAMVWEAFEWDRWPQQALLAVSLIGFPIVLAFAWFYRATPSGVILRSEQPYGPSASSQTGWQKWVIAALVLALGLSIYWNVQEVMSPDAAIAERRVAVLPIVNQTEDASLNWLGLGMMSLVNTQLNDAGIATVSSRAVMNALDEGETSFSDEAVELLQKTQGLGLTVELQIRSRGGEFEVSGVYGDQSARFELPVFGAAEPAQAVRRMTDHLIRSMNPSPGVDGQMESVGDVFVDQVFARAMYELLSGNLQRAKEMLVVASNAAPDSFWPNYELSVAMRNLGELAEAQERNLVLLAKAKSDQQAEQVAVLSNELGVINDLSGDLDQSERHYLEGLEWAERGGEHHRRAILLINYAILERARANPLRARELLGQAVAAYEQAGIELLPGDFYITMGNASADAGDHIAAQEQYRQGLANFRAMQNPRGEGIALSNLSWVSDQLGNFDAALAYLEESEDLRARIGDEIGLLKSRSRRADLYFELGRLDEVLVIAEEIAANEYAEQERELLTNAWSYQAEVAMVREEYDRALDLYQRAYALDVQDGRIFQQIRARLGEVRALIGQQSFVDANKILTTLSQSDEYANFPAFQLQAMGLMATVEWRTGAQEKSLARLREAIDEARRVGNNRQLGLLSAKLVGYYEELGNIDQMAAWTGVASEALPSHARVHLARARLSLVRNEFEAAEASLQAAEAAMGERVAKEVAELRAQLKSRA